MGTQQMLLLVMGVIVVGLLLAAGIYLFSLHAYNSNRNNLITELNTYPPLVLKYYYTSKQMGGANGNISNVTKEKIASYIGFTGPNLSLSSPNGEYRVTGLSGRYVVLKGLGTATRKGKRPMVTITINLDTKAVTRTLSDATGW